ncbi:MAG: DUF5996 family protein [Pseudonocardiaceae bacterium]
MHHFWHTFDIALTRLADTAVDQPPSNDPVTREAYSREVISFEFWFGDPTYPEPVFYSYTAPEPVGVAKEPLPANAQWLERRTSRLAVLPYDDVRTRPDRKAVVLNFYEDAYQAGASRARWDIDRYTSLNGVTDPQRRQQPHPPRIGDPPCQVRHGGRAQSRHRREHLPQTHQQPPGPESAITPLGRSHRRVQRLHHPKPITQLGDRAPVRKLIEDLHHNEAVILVSRSH